MKKVIEITLLEATIGLIKGDGYESILLNPLTIEMDNNKQVAPGFLEATASLLNYYTHLKSDIDLYKNVYESLEKPDENYSHSIASELSIYIIQKNGYTGNELLVTEFTPKLKKWYIQNRFN